MHNVKVIRYIANGLWSYFFQKRQFPTRLALVPLKMSSISVSVSMSFRGNTAIKDVSSMEGVACPNISWVEILI